MHHNHIFSSSTHTNPIARRAAVCFQPSEKSIKPVEKPTANYNFSWKCPINQPTRERWR